MTKAGEHCFLWYVVKKNDLPGFNNNKGHDQGWLMPKDWLTQGRFSLATTRFAAIAVGRSDVEI